MKLCYVLNQFPELSQTFVLRQILDLIQRGHEVDVVAARVGSDVAYHAALGGAQLRSRLAPRTRYTGMPEGMLARTLRGLLLSLPAAVTHPKAVAVGLDVHRFGWFAATGSLLTMGLPLIDECRHYDAIIAHFGPQGMVAQGLREMGVLAGPLVTFFHAYDLTSAPKLVGNRMYRRLFEKGELQLAISERGARQLVELGAPPERVRVHHMGVDSTTFHPPCSPRAAGTSRIRRVVSIGRLVAKKGFEHGLRAVAKARAHGARLEYAIYGTGPMALELERSIDRLGLRGWARLCGPASQEALAETLRCADVLLTPSTTSQNGDEEGIPMVLMEAMATELPVVATNCGGVSELVEHERCGLLVPEGDADAMSEALIRLSAFPELALSLGRAGRARVLAEFDQAEQGRKLVDLLTRLGGQA
jgi:colanic acid/amylovoran biosynthesis glycosyltransferase